LGRSTTLIHCEVAPTWPAPFIWTWRSSAAQLSLPDDAGVALGRHGVRARILKVGEANKRK
jgi:hypothetical protein